MVTDRLLRKAAERRTNESKGGKSVRKNVRSVKNVRSAQNTEVEKDSSTTTIVKARYGLRLSELVIS